MTDSILTQVLPYESLATAYVQAKFGQGRRSAARVVGKVLAGFVGKAPRSIPNPKRFLLGACRRQALRSCGRAHPVAGEKAAPEVLIALEDEDRPKFFGPSGTRRLLMEAKTASEETALHWAATLGASGTPIQVEVRVVHKTFRGDAA